MRRRIQVGLVIVVLAGFCAAVSTRGAEQSWVGMITDSTCHADHGGEIDPKECTAKCVRNGDKYELATNGGVKILKIANQDFPALATHAGEVVRVTGELNGESISITAIAPE